MEVYTVLSLGKKALSPPSLLSLAFFVHLCFSEINSLRLKQPENQHCGFYSIKQNRKKKDKDISLSPARSI